MGFYSGAQAVSPGALVVSDNDTSITYFGDWSVIYSAPRSAIYFQDTMHTTKTAGDHCTFTFTGTAVWYFTDYFSGNAAVDISIDGGPAEPVLTASAGGAGLTQRIAWSMVDLSKGPHTVRITHAGDGDYASVDFFMYLPSKYPINLTNIHDIHKHWHPNISNNIQPGYNHRLVPAIIGGAVGTLAILALFAAFVIYMRYRRSNPTLGQAPAQTPAPALMQTQPSLPGMPEMSSKPGQTYFDYTRVYQSA
ncbi:hypothetical protein RhiJN_09777 [Ceratobasidium sp. AG-Ba]|nr:hypothetical protein RhiJN_09777 [Ceratobasidium sp. AG-Ba]